LKFNNLILSNKNYHHTSSVTETLNSDKSDSNQCYSELESSTAHYSHSTVVSI